MGTDHGKTMVTRMAHSLLDSDVVVYVVVLGRSTWRFSPFAQQFKFVSLYSHVGFQLRSILVVEKSSAMWCSAKLQALRYRSRSSAVSIENSHVRLLGVFFNYDSEGFPYSGNNLTY